MTTNNPVHWLSAAPNTPAKEYLIMISAQMGRTPDTLNEEVFLPLITEDDVNHEAINRALMEAPPLEVALQATVITEAIDYESLEIESPASDIGALKSSLSKSIASQKTDAERKEEELSQIYKVMIRDENQLRAYESLNFEVPKLAEQVEKIEKEGFWKLVAYKKDMGAVFHTTRCVYIKEYNPAAGIDISVNTGQFACCIPTGTTTQEEVKVVPTFHTIALDTIKNNFRCPHPHISSSGNICWGSGKKDAIGYMIAGDYVSLLNDLQTVLENYEPSNPYVNIHEMKRRDEGDRYLRTDYFLISVLADYMGLDYRHRSKFLKVIWESELTQPDPALFIPKENDLVELEQFKWIYRNRRVSLILGKLKGNTYRCFDILQDINKEAIEATLDNSYTVSEISKLTKLRAYDFSINERTIRKGDYIEVSEEKVKQINSALRNCKGLGARYESFFERMVITDEDSIFSGMVGRLIRNSTIILEDSGVTVDSYDFINYSDIANDEEINHDQTVREYSWECSDCGHDETYENDPDSKVNITEYFNAAYNIVSDECGNCGYQSML